MKIWISQAIAGICLLLSVAGLAQRPVVSVSSVLNLAQTLPVREQRELGADLLVGTVGFDSQGKDVAQAAITSETHVSKRVVLTAPCISNMTFGRTLTLVPAPLSGASVSGCIVLVKPEAGLQNYDASAQVVILGAKVSP